jgi:hypothetical protein
LIAPDERLFGIPTMEIRVTYGDVGGKKTYAASVAVDFTGMGPMALEEAEVEVLEKLVEEVQRLRNTMDGLCRQITKRGNLSDR